MCGRFTLRASSEELTRHFKLKKSIYMKSRYNIAPNQLLPIIRQTGEIEFMNWGFIPYWKKDADQGYINVRAETIHIKPSFKKAFQQRRALVISDGYYEWKQIGKQKQPFYIRRKDDGLFAFAAIWEDTGCAIVTTAANSVLSVLHERMPVIIFPENYEIWLDKKNNIQQIIYPLLNVAPNDLWEIFPVTSKMNDPKFDRIECIHSLQ